jgi:hypothetical protein
MFRKIYLFAIIDPNEYEPESTFDEVDGDDYLVYAIFDVESNKIVFLHDNMHDRPGDFMRGFLRGILCCGQDYEVIKDVLRMMNRDNHYHYNAVHNAIKKYFEGVK